jgi:hypothetical protein
MLRPDIPDPVKPVVRKIKTLFRRQQWNEFSMFLFFVLLSAGFWFLLSLQQEYEMEIVVPVKYKNIPAQMTLSGDNPVAVVAKVKDKGTVLVNYLWMYSFDPVEVNVKELQKNDTQLIVSAKTIESNLSKQLISSTTLLRVEPQSIRIEHTELQTGELPVLAEVAVSLESGYQVSDPIVTPPKVRVYASKTVLDTLSALKTVPVELKKMSGTQSISVALQEIPGVRTDPEKVVVTIPVEEFTEKQLTIPVLCKSLPENYTLHLFPASVEVTCNVPVSHFNDLSEADFEIQIPFQEFEAGQESGKITVRLTKQPSLRVTDPVIRPDVVEFIIERNDP